MAGCEHLGPERRHGGSERLLLCDLCAARPIDLAQASAAGGRAAHFGERRRGRGLLHRAGSGYRESAAERRGGAGGSDPSRSRTPSGPAALQGASREPWLSTLWFSPGLRLLPGLGTERVSRCLCPCDSPPVPVCKGARSLQRTHLQPNLRILVGVAQTWGRSREPSTCASPAAPRRFRSAPRAQGPLRSRAPLTPPRLVRYMALQMAPLPHFNITVYGSLSRPRGNYIYLAFITYISTRPCHCVLLSVLC